MSRRGPPPTDTAERNRAALKALVKLESNKSCADCKRNKHPRWASWNLGIFVCIRCSGIHRSMGVHISRVKSVDLDSWTDEQMQSMVKWGNKRANRYWEHKLAEGHVPNEAKIENFIRTKYDSRRWVMDGPMPDPATLDAADDDDVPLKAVQDRVRATSGAQQRNGSAPVGAALAQPPRAKPQDIDFFGGMDEPTPARPSTTEPAVSRAPPPPKAPAAVPKQTKPGESLLGLDFFGGTQSAPPARPSSTGPNAGAAPGRTDLKQSILSLYASKPAAPPQQPAASNVNAFGGMQSPPLTSPTQATNTQALGDAFGGLSFNSAPPQQSKPAPFSGLTSPTGHSRGPSMSKSSLSGGSFFDMKPTPPAKNTPPPPQPTTVARKESFGADFGDFSSAVTSPAPTSAKSPPAPASSGMGDLFDLASPTSSAPAPKPAPAPVMAKSPPPIQASNYSQNSAFNLSQTQPASAPKPAPATQPSNMSAMGSLNNMDAWGSDNAWASPDPEPAPAQPTTAASPPTNTSNFSPPAPTPAAPAAAPKMESPFDSGWGDSEPVAPAKPANTTTSAGGWNVQQDDEFGDWGHASPVATTSAPKQGGGGGAAPADDLFGNVWQ